MVRTLLNALLAVTEVDVMTAIVFVWFERVRPSLPAQRHWRRGMLVDIGYTYIGCFVGLFTTMIGFGYLFESAAAGAHRALGGLHAFVGSAPFILQLVFAVVVSDLFGYWKHRTLHTRLLWPFHAVHHSSEEVDWLSNERMHPVEMVVTSLFFVIPLAMLGVPAVVIAWTAQIRRYHSIYEHANLAIDYKRGHYVLVSPVFHRWHHSRDATVVDKNFANIFAFFDWAFGTFKMPEAAPPAGGFGVPGFPLDLWRQTVVPFRDAVLAVQKPAQRLRW